MTQEEKDSILKDLCSRLPYGVMCRYQHIQYIENGKLIDINMFGRVNIDGHIKDICDIKPYLFPLSSMTEEQKLELTTIKTYVSLNKNKEYLLFDWLNANHFDYRGLLEKGLAIDATNLNIY